METGINNTFLYSAYFLRATHHGEDPNAPKIASGTGFVVHADSGNFIFVTNRHLLDLPWREGAQFRGFHLSGLELRTHMPSSDGPPKLASPILVRPQAIRYHPDETVDIAGFPLKGNIYWEFTTIPNSAPKSMIANDDQFDSAIDAGDIVYFPGYPEWYDKNGDRPIMRTGAIVSDPRSDYRYDEGPPNRTDGNKQILFEAFSTSGNSGSPLFVSQRGYQVGDGLEYTGAFRPVTLIGINAGHYRDPEGHHVGLSRAYKSTAILEFIDNLLSAT